MDNLLLKYLENKFQQPSLKDACGPNPFITISREYGCPSKLIAKILAEELNKRVVHGKAPKWRYINKEIVEESAKELHLDPAKIKSILSAEHIGTIDDVLASFSTDYKSTHRIKKIIREVIKSFCLKGHIIMVGRGGVAITQNCPNSLHIRLQAPLKWRMQDISSRHQISEAEALKRIMDFDKKRKALIELFLDQKFDNTMFDLIFNCKTLSKEEIVRSIIHMMELRGMI